MGIAYDQPRLIPPMRPEPQHHRRASRSSTVTAKWVARSRSLASRASTAGSILSRRRRASTARRPTIGAPSDFRRIQNHRNRRLEGFRPLELSIYLPQNRLSPLPDFSSPCDERRDQNSAALALPPLRTASILSFPPSDFRIARKPLRSTVDLSWSPDAYRNLDPRSTPSDWLVQPLRPRPSFPSSLNSRELVPFPQTHSLTSPPISHTRSATEPLHLLSRRDSNPFGLERNIPGEGEHLEQGRPGSGRIPVASFNSFSAGHPDDGMSPFSRTGLHLQVLTGLIIGLMSCRSLLTLPISFATSVNHISPTSVEAASTTAFKLTICLASSPGSTLSCCSHSVSRGIFTPADFQLVVHNLKRRERAGNRLITVKSSARHSSPIKDEVVGGFNHVYSNNTGGSLDPTGHDTATISWASQPKSTKNLWLGRTEHPLQTNSGTAPQPGMGGGRER